MALRRAIDEAASRHRCLPQGGRAAPLPRSPVLGDHRSHPRSRGHAAAGAACSSCSRPTLISTAPNDGPRSSPSSAPTSHSAEGEVAQLEAQAGRDDRVPAPSCASIRPRWSSCRPPTRRPSPATRSCSPSTRSCRRPRREIQSANEELATLSQELQDRNLKLGQSNDDLLNLLGSVKHSRGHGGPRPPRAPLHSRRGPALQPGARGRGPASSTSRIACRLPSWPGRSGTCSTP